jgi:hypothetical protein
MEPVPTVSAIVVIVDDDVHSVYLVPCKEALADNMSKLRTLRDELLKKYDRHNNIRLQRVWVSNADQQAKTYEDVAMQLDNIISNL